MASVVLVTSFARANVFPFRLVSEEWSVRPTTRLKLNERKTRRSNLGNTAEIV